MSIFKELRTVPHGKHSVTIIWWAYVSSLVEMGIGNSSKLIELLGKSNQIIHVECSMLGNFSMHGDWITVKGVYRVIWIKWPSHSVYPSVEHCKWLWGCKLHRFKLFYSKSYAV